jgi:CrcB protein
MDAIAVFLGGGCGASLRYLLGLLANKKLGITYWSTFLINVLGCLFLGFVTTLVINHPNLLHHNVYLFLTTGVTGGFTTFSTFSYENLTLLKEGEIQKSLLYMTSSLFCGVFGIYLGYLLAHCS